MSKTVGQNSNSAASSQPDYLGHRQRLRERFLRNGLEGMLDYEVMELVLTMQGCKAACPCVVKKIRQCHRGSFRADKNAGKISRTRAQFRHRAEDNIFHHPALSAGKNPKKGFA